MRGEEGGENRVRQQTVQWAGLRLIGRDGMMDSVLSSVRRRTNVKSRDLKLTCKWSRWLVSEVKCRRCKKSAHLQMW